MSRFERDRGAADALGLVLIAPVVVGLALLVVSLGRNVDSRAQARSAAESAAQAAALERTPSAATSAAERVATAMLIDADSCHDPTIEVDTHQFRAGGQVAVTIECHVSTRGVDVVQPSVLAHSARAVAHIDRFRASEDPP